MIRHDCNVINNNNETDETKINVFKRILFDVKKQNNIHKRRTDLFTPAQMTVEFLVSETLLLHRTFCVRNFRHLAAADV